MIWITENFSLVAVGPNQGVLALVEHHTVPFFFCSFIDSKQPLFLTQLDFQLNGYISVSYIQSIERSTHTFIFSLTTLRTCYRVLTNESSLAGHGF